MDDKSKNWFAVHTKSRQEKVALEHLQRQSFDCFLPMTSSRQALFPGYLFLHADQREQSLSSVRSTRGAIGLIRAGVVPSTVPAALIASLKARLDPASGWIRTHTAGLKAGDSVQVIDGPLAPLEGIFREHRGQRRSLLLLEILGRNTSVEVDSRALRRIR